MVPGLIISDRTWSMAQLATAGSFFFVGLMRCFYGVSPRKRAPKTC